ncbi:MAG TPA: peroxidase family protein, partial [Actinomycetes bacterium]|nr:peroxidase family protein [Actinomycetes bacterium]
GGGFGNVSAGYTYLGQFFDHDLTFDRTTVALGENVPLAQLLQARSPSLDLDSLYGAGPSDPESARFYKDDRHLKMGKTVAIDPDPAHAGHDLPRGAGTTQKQKRKAVIPDPRNDENLAVAQTHTAFIRFHNRLVDTLPASTAAAQRFTRARELAVKHYQWMIWHDYLPRIMAKSVLNSVMSGGRKLVEPSADPTDMPAMPVEFSVAAFRLGHSMIRRSYNWNARFPDGQGTLDFLFIFSGTGGDLLGGLRLPSNWIADWRRMYDLAGETGRADLAAPGGLNKAMRIDSALVNPLANLPTGSFGGPVVPFGDPIANLAFRNLTRAKMLRLASGQQMAALLRQRGVPVTTLTRAQLRTGSNGASLDGLTATQRDSVLAKTPLWFYVLREAEMNGGKLKGVGARIVAETVHRAMEGSRFSIVRDEAFRPTLGPDSTTFRMSDLLMFAFDRKKALLAPLT